MNVLTVALTVMALYLIYQYIVLRKRVTELKKENVELKRQNNVLSQSVNQYRNLLVENKITKPREIFQKSREEKKREVQKGFANTKVFESKLDTPKPVPVENKPVVIPVDEKVYIENEYQKFDTDEINHNKRVVGDEVQAEENAFVDIEKQWAEEEKRRAAVKKQLAQMKSNTDNKLKINK